MKAAAISMETGLADGMSNGATETAMKLRCLKVDLIQIKHNGMVIPACSNLLLCVSAISINALC